MLIPGRLRAVSRWHCTGMTGGAGEFCNLPSLALRLALGAFRGGQPGLGLHRQVVSFRIDSAQSPPEFRVVSMNLVFLSFGDRYPSTTAMAADSRVQSPLVGILGLDPNRTSRNDYR